MVAISRISTSWSMNQGSILVASKTCSGVAPARSARITTPSRPSCGRPARVSRSSTGSRISPANTNGALGSSRLRSALPSASVKLRPMAMASPTLFMWVVSVESAEGNFSKANRGTLTTT